MKILFYHCIQSVTCVVKTIKMIQSTIWKKIEYQFGFSVMRIMFRPPVLPCSCHALVPQSECEVQYWKITLIKVTPSPPYLGLCGGCLIYSLKVDVQFHFFGLSQVLSQNYTLFSICLMFTCFHCLFSLNYKIYTLFLICLLFSKICTRNIENNFFCFPCKSLKIENKMKTRWHII